MKVKLQPGDSQVRSLEVTKVAQKCVCLVKTPTRKLQSSNHRNCILWTLY